MEWVVRQGPLLDCPLQKNRSLKDMSQEEQHVYKEQRRQSHISAEQKRRGNIKHGFDRLQSMVIKMVPPSAGKMSKASVLLKSKSCTTHCKLSCGASALAHPLSPLSHQV